MDLHGEDIVPSRRCVAGKGKDLRLPLVGLEGGVAGVARGIIRNTERTDPESVEVVHGTVVQIVGGVEGPACSGRGCLEMGPEIVRLDVRAIGGRDRQRCRDPDRIEG